MNFFADLHCDTLCKCYEKGQSLSDRSLQINKWQMAGFERYIQVFAHYISERQVGKWSWLQGFLDFSTRFLNENQIPVFKNADDLAVSKCAVLSVENGDIFSCEKDVDARIAMLKEYGISFFSLIYNHDNLLGSGALSENDGGLTSLGYDVVKCLEAYDIIVDVSHASYRSTDDILNVSRRPVCATHSNAYKLCAHDRNLRDEHLKAIANSGGLVGINLYPPFLSVGKATLDDIADHIYYVLDICGSEQVAFGCDFDGIDYSVKGIDGLASVVKIADLMKKRGCNESVIEKIFYKNVYEFLKANFRR